MFKNYFYLVNKLFKTHKKIYNFRNESLVICLMQSISYHITPFFIYLKFSPNLITGINFIIAIISIIFIFSYNLNLYKFGILLYFIYIIFDACDGSIARFKNKSTFYGRFLDSILDIFCFTMIILSIHFFCYRLYANETLFTLGVISSLFFCYSCCIHDKYSALARWCNEENKTEIVPYLRKSFYPRINYTVHDLFLILIFSTPFLIKNKYYFLYLLQLLVLITFLSSIVNILKHIFYAKKNFLISARIKKNYNNEKK